MPSRASKRTKGGRMIGSPVAVVGSGVIGRSWTMVFARAGCPTRVYDRDSSQLQRARRWLKEEIRRAVAGRLLTRRQAAAIERRVSWHRDLREAVTGVAYVQESGPEELKIKRAI